MWLLLVTIKRVTKTALPADRVSTSAVHCFFSSALALVDLKESDAGRVYWISNQKILKIVKDAGYEVTSIKRISDAKPRRYNKP